MDRPLLSIIIPAHNEEKDISECLKSLKKQDYKKIEIIVVDDGSTDKTKEAVKKFSKKVRIFEQNHRGPGAARNLGAKKAKGEILIFVDSDMTFDKKYLTNLIKPIISNEREIGTTHELELVKNTKNIWGRCWGKIKISKKQAKKEKIFRAILKKKFLELGGFDSKYGYADDQTFWFKYKIKPIVAQKTICYHKNPETLEQVYHQSKWIGASIDSFFLKIPLFNYLILVICVVLSPIAILLLAIRKSLKNRDLKILFPYMLGFMSVRYFGTLSGIFNKIHFKKNTR